MKADNLIIKELAEFLRNTDKTSYRQISDLLGHILASPDRLRSPK